MPEWLTPRQASKEAGRSLRTVRRWMADGLPSLQIGGRTFIRSDDLYAHLRKILVAEPESKTRWEQK